jgi:hypothetical protein
MLGSCCLLGLGFTDVNSFIGTKNRARHRRAFFLLFDATTLQGDGITFPLRLTARRILSFDPSKGSISMKNLTLGRRHK